MSNIDEWFQDMINKGLACTSRTWIDLAIRQRHPRLTVELAYSTPLVYDALDRLLLRSDGLN